MAINWLNKLRGLRQTLAFRYMPKVADLSAWAATYRSVRQLSLMGEPQLLIDSNVLAHAITHESAWIDTGTTMWGGNVPIKTGYMARIPVHSVNNSSKEYRDICYITGIAYLARHHHISLFTSAELMAEQDRQPPARFQSVDWSGMSLFDGIKIQSIDGWCFDSLIYTGSREDVDLAGLQRARLRASNDPLYKALMNIFKDEKHSQDAWHIRTAEVHGFFGFLTMDYKLLRLLQNRKSQLSQLNLGTKVLSPEQFGSLFRMRPVPPYLFSYDNASFPVRPDLCWPDERRRSTRRRSKSAE